MTSAGSQLIDAAQAQAIVLRLCEESGNEKFAIQSCEFSARGNCWIVRANSADYVLHGRAEHCYVGVNAYLVDGQSGSIEIVGSGRSVEHYLQDKEDLRAAGGQSYVLGPAFDSANKAKVIRLRQAVACPSGLALQMLAPQNRAWLTGALQVLKDAQSMLETQDIPTQIILQPDPGRAVEIDHRVWHWEALKAVLKSKADSLG